MADHAPRACGRARFAGEEVAAVAHFATLFPGCGCEPLRRGLHCVEEGQPGEADMDRRKTVSETHRGEVEPEIIPPDVRARDPYSRTSFDGAQRIYVARIGPVGFALMTAAIAALAALFFILLLGAFHLVIGCVRRPAPVGRLSSGDHHRRRFAPHIYLAAVTPALNGRISLHSSGLRACCPFTFRNVDRSPPIAKIMSGLTLRCQPARPDHGY